MEQSVEILDREEMRDPEVAQAFNWYAQAWKKYGIGKGRAPRLEYWIWQLYNLAFSCVALTLDKIMGLTFEDAGVGPVYILWALAIIVPTITLSIRRMQDTGRHGTWVLIALVPLVGPIWFLVLTLLPSQKEANTYGENPLRAVEHDGYRVGVPDNIITFSVLWSLFSVVRWFVVQEIFNNFSDGSGGWWSEEWYVLYRMISSYIWAIEPVALVAIIPRKQRRTWLLWIAGAICLYQIGSTWYEIVNSF